MALLDSAAAFDNHRNQVEEEMVALMAAGSQLECMHLLDQVLLVRTPVEWQPALAVLED